MADPFDNIKHIRGLPQVQIYGLGEDGNLYPLSADTAGGLSISGVAITSLQYTASSTGDNTVLSVATGTILQLRKLTVNVDADVTGNIVLKVGSTVLNEAQNLIGGGNHVLFDAGESYTEGGSGDDLVINLPASVTAEVTAYYTTRSV